MRRRISDTFLGFVKRWGVPALVLAGAGFAAAPLEKPAWTAVKATLPELSAETLSETAGTGVVLGTIGGFRTVLADIAWLRAFHFWSERDLQSCEALTDLARALDPQNYFFWEHSVNYVAFDFPSWIVSARGGRRVSPQVRAEIHRKAYERALELIGQMEKRFPGEGKVFALGAQVSNVKTPLIYGRPDFESALAFYKKAMESRRAPWFTFLSYATIVKLHFPERVPETERYFRKQLAEAERRGNAGRAKILAEALDELLRPETE